MNPNREAALFELALEKPAENRGAFLDAMCEGDVALRQRLAALLAAHEQTEGALAEPPSAAKATMKVELPDVPDETVGQKIGRYKILEKVGEGGCGVVYVAEQTESVRRRVALKVIKLGMDTKQVVARFEAERQALAMMDHPNISKVLDAGATDTGRPYFIMELVRGIRITDYCDQANLPTKDRLDLFIQVCHAIQHAHQKGIIHRDIKPSNILVTLHDGVPVPKVIDFGIAKATEGRLTDATVYTQLQQFIGTPAYMSPEQAEMSGLDIDTRSDIYSLGVLLYELLAGSTPIDGKELMSMSLDAMRKTIREKEPARPSLRLATLQGDELTTTAKRRAVEAPKLIHLLKGDLDWIVMKCLEKDRARRYETANGLAADIKRHLENEPVVARPPSKLYEFQKTVRRHKFGFAATAAVIIVLLAGVLVSTWQAMRATNAKREALAAQTNAVAAQASEAKMRKQAQTEELAARQRAYASDMNVAMQALDGNNLGRALDLLSRQRPEPGQRDLRGWEWRYLWQQTRSDALFTFCQEASEVYALAVSADGRWLATGVMHQGGLSVWDVRTRQKLICLAKDEEDVRAAFSPTEPLLAFAGVRILSSGEKRYSLRLWNAATRQMVAETPLDQECIGLAFARDGRTLVTLIREREIAFWRTTDGTKLTSYPARQSLKTPGTSFAATPDLSLAAYNLPGGAAWCRGPAQWQTIMGCGGCESISLFPCVFTRWQNSGLR
jgi:serine/threonine protein kinase/type II secretory pathway pseudopilin PulG